MRDVELANGPLSPSKYRKIIVGTLLKGFPFTSKLKASEYIYEYVKGTEPFVRRFQILKGLLYMF